jgi:membrane-associated phospholipid phosphatase
VPTRSLLALALAAFVVARTEAAPLRYDPKLDVVLTAVASAVALGLAAPSLTPAECRFCAPGGLDASAREALRWRSPEDARLASDVLANGIVPAGAVLTSVVSSWSEGHLSAAAVDVLVLAEAAALAAVPVALAKDVVARARPAGAGNRSFYSGHTSLAFSIAAAAGEISTIRGRRSAPWVWAVGMTLATGVAYLRVAGDAHWVSDVLTGAAAGGLVGFAVPWALHRPRGVARYAVVPAPGGLAIVF